jgi:hypothetical protein
MSMMSISSSKANSELVNDKLIQKLEKAISLCVQKLAKYGHNDLNKTIDRVTVNYNKGVISMLFTAGEEGIFSKRSKKYLVYKNCVIHDINHKMEVVYLFTRRANIPSENLSYKDYLTRYDVLMEKPSYKAYSTQLNKNKQYDVLFLRKGKSIDFYFTAIRKFNERVYNEILDKETITTIEIYYIPFNTKMGASLTPQNFHKHRVFMTKMTGLYEDVILKNKDLKRLHEPLFPRNNNPNIPPPFFERNIDDMVFDEQAVRAIIVQNDKIVTAFYNDGKIRHSNMNVQLTKKEMKTIENTLKEIFKIRKEKKWSDDLVHYNGSMLIN